MKNIANHYFRIIVPTYGQIKLLADTKNTEREAFLENLELISGGTIDETEDNNNYVLGYN